MSKYQYKRIRKPDDCGCWVPATQSFCAKPGYLWRRCEEHYVELTHDDLYETLRAMSLEQRQKALDMLDDVQKHRPKWEFAGAEDELTASQEIQDAK
jgi:hypothetical protein